MLVLFVLSPSRGSEHVMERKKRRRNYKAKDQLEVARHYCMINMDPDTLEKVYINEKIGKKLPCF